MVPGHHITKNSIANKRPRLSMDSSSLSARSASNNNRSSGDMEGSMEFSNATAATLHGETIDVEIENQNDFPVSNDPADDATPGDEQGEDEPSSYENEVREEREQSTRQAAEKLQGILGDVKETTRKLLSEIDTYLQSMESVAVDYMKCKESQNNEARRLEEVEPDVSGATGRFLHMLQQGGTTLGSML